VSADGTNANRLGIQFICGGHNVPTQDFLSFCGLEHEELASRKTVAWSCATHNGNTTGGRASIANLQEERFWAHRACAARQVVGHANEFEPSKIIEEQARHNPDYRPCSRAEYEEAR
jgi:hypothetical protein